MVDGQTLNGSDRFGSWKTNSLEGWWDSPDAKDQSEEHENADGADDQPSYYKARYPTITGRLIAPSHAVLHEAANRFTGLVRRKARMQVSGHGPTQWADVKRASGLTFVPVTATVAQWQLRLKCPDPRKFGELREFQATVGAPAKVFHRGNHDGLPVVEVVGSMPGGYQLVFVGGTVWVKQPLVSGTPHLIDYNTGRLTVGGVVVHGQFGTTNIQPLPPGTDTNASIAPVTTGTGTATFKVLDTFI